MRLVSVLELWLLVDLRQRHCERLRSIDVWVVFRKAKGFGDGFEKIIVLEALPIGKYLVRQLHVGDEGSFKLI